MSDSLNIDFPLCLNPDSCSNTWRVVVQHLSDGLYEQETVSVCSQSVRFAPQSVRSGIDYKTFIENLSTNSQ